MSKENRNKKRPAPTRLITRQEYVRNIREITGQSRKNMRWQTALIWLVLVGFILAIVVSLYQISVIEHKDYSELAARTHARQTNIYPDRGNIYGSNGEELAVSTYTYTIGVSPQVYGPSRASSYTQEEVEAGMAEILDIDLARFQENLETNAEAAYMVVKRNISPDMNDELKEFMSEARVSGVTIDANQARYYPKGDYASNIIGFANKTDQTLSGVSGIELSYNELLSGKTGYSYEEVDNYWRQAIPGSLSASIEAVPGQNIRLSLQEDLQLYIQDRITYLEEAYTDNDGSQIIVLDAQTGAILAYTSDVTYDLNNPTAAPSNIDPEEWNPSGDQEDLEYMTGTVWSNKAVRYPYEVGSVMKPFVMSMAFDEAKLKDGDYLNDDPITIDTWTMSSYDNVSRGMLTAEETIWDSRNPAFVRLGEALGLDTFYNYIDLLGFTSLTGIDLPNETVGLFHQNPKRIDMAVTSFGEQVTMTLAQLANGYLALANDGVMITPHVADAILDEEGQVISTYPVEKKRQVFSAQTTQDLLEMMIGVGRYGTGKSAYFPGVEVAFKSGTSTRAVDGSAKDNVATYTTVGLMPADKPEYLVITVTHDSEFLGSGISYRILGDVLEYIAIRDNYDFEYKAYDYNLLFNDLYITNYIGRNVAEAAGSMGWRGMQAVADGDVPWDGTIRSQYPTPGYLGSFDAHIWVSDEAGDLPENFVTLPDFTGLDAHEARQLAKAINLNIKLTGPNRAGVVTSQLVLDANIAGGSEAGDSVREYSQIILSFDGTGAPGVAYDDSIVAGYNQGTR